MGSGINARTAVEGVAAVAASSVLFYFGNGMNPVWPLMWLAFVPLLWFALRSHWLVGACAAIATMLLGNLNMWSYLTKTLGAPRIVWFELFIEVGLVLAAGVLLCCALVRRGALWSGVVALPAVWVCAEYLRNFITPHGSAGSLAYSQLRFLPFLQLASVTGPWGMSFVVLMFSSALAIWLHLRNRSSGQATRVLTVTIVSIGVILVLGAVRLALPAGPTVRVGLIASDLKENDRIVDSGAETEQLFRDYARAAETLISQGARAVVIPEKLGVTLEGKSAPADNIFQSLADRTGATIVAGVVHVNGSTMYNEARVYVRGQTVQRYDKEHMLPPFESDLKPGSTLTLLPRGEQLWGVAICKDMDFSSPARRYGNAHAGLMLVPAWDFVVDASWHGHIAIMRGVEDGFTIARAAKNGFLTVSDYRGRILGEVRSDAAPFSTLLVDAPEEHHWTIYQVAGDWFAWVSVAELVIVVARLIWARPQQRSQTARVS